MKKLRFRQVHLDFHTSEHIENIGSDFDSKRFVNTLKAANIDSITCFSKCHHGWSYHQTSIGKPHPHLKCELLPLQIESCHKAGIDLPVYISVGWDELAAKEHPDWQVVSPDGSTEAVFNNGWRNLCKNSDYLEYVISQTKEVIANYEVDGLFFDIIVPWDCHCNKCIADMLKKNLNPKNPDDRKRFQHEVLINYYKRMNDAVHSIKPDLSIFHNSGHIYPQFIKYQTHLELESLPTGGWGYDHFPMLAKYCSQLDYDFLGMTGKFHTTWGEFGGFKHPNALKYECSAMLAYGAKCSIGDQLDPNGKLDKGTYKLIAQAYEEVKEKEEYCDNVDTVAEIGLLASDLNDRNKQSDIGANRVLLEGHFLFDVITNEMDFSKYRLLVLPDDSYINTKLKNKLENYVSNGGKLLLTGQSGFDSNGDFIFDAGADFYDISKYMPDFILPEKPYCPDFISTPMVMYMKSERIKVTDGQSLGKVYDPYFKRSHKQFCSHQHAPAKKEHSGYDCGAIKDNICYLAHPVFSIYSAFGNVALKDYVIKTIKQFLGQPMLTANLPSTARLSLMNQAQNNRYILHLLYANTIKRGGDMELESAYCGKTQNIEVVEDLMPIYDIDIECNIDKQVKSVSLQPENRSLIFTQRNGSIKFKVDKLLCHQMVELNY